MIQFFWSRRYSHSETLEQKVTALEASLGKFLALDAGTAEPGSLTADLEAARAVCEAVEGLIEGREWQV